MPSDTYNLIRQAILDKQQVIADYGGQRREMCPHAIGTKNGREQPSSSNSAVVAPVGSVTRRATGAASTSIF